MKEIKATQIALVVVLGAIAFVSPVSAYLITNGQVSYDAAKDETTWTYDVNCDRNDKDISHWTVAWCRETAVKEVWVKGIKLKRDKDPGWDYVTAGKNNPVMGIKIDYQVKKKDTVHVVIILSGQYGTADVDYAIKAGKDNADGTVFGPSHEVSIPEFATIVIPVVAILGLLFFFNRRKQGKE